ncbi:type II secretion system F family protein [Pseudonocardia sp. TRM90224]|uniref:type II secretion system F family protein n=1 Tax=Pseudonocardia sp. TRM90224 TaxID=2812678 RepID=UPI001E64C301|nr:type II secretion system F family protein [Pseudonocardia sp. TRM90224]
MSTLMRTLSTPPAELPPPLPPVFPHLPPDLPPGLAVAAAVVAGAVLMTGRPSSRARLGSLAMPPSEESVAAEPVGIVGVVVGALASALVAGLVAGVIAGALCGGAAAAVGAVALRGRKAPPDDEAVLAERWELLAVCLEAGLPVAAAVAAAAEPLNGPAGGRLRRVAGLLELGADADDAWSTVEDVPALSAFARAAGRSAGTGAALAQVASTEAARLRSTLVDAAHARAQRAAVLIAGPLALCFLPAFLVLGVAPVVIGLADRTFAQW